MVKKPLLVVLVLAVAFVVVLAVKHFWRPNDLKSRLAAVAAAVSKAPGEGNSVMIVKMQRFQSLLADPVELKTGRHGLGATYSPEELASTAVRIRAGVGQMDFTFKDVTVVRDDGQTAELSCTMRVTGTNQGGERWEETAELTVKAKRVEGAWRFTEFADVGVLKQ